MSNYIYGIDFGTSNSALAVLNKETNQVIKLFTTPSLLFFPEPQSPRENIEGTVGEKAISLYVENRMRGRFMKSIKKVLPNKSFIDTKIGSKSFRAEDLVALVLVYLKQKADDFVGETVTSAIIGRPVVFDENPEKDVLAQERLAKAAKIAGFTTIHFQLEPIGAAFTYERQISKQELVLVADFGGGTSDFSLMKLNPASILKADRKADMIAQGGIYIGGDSFDADIMWHKGTPHFGRGVKEEFTPGKAIDLPLSYFHNICSWEKMNFLDTLRMKISIAKSYQFSGKDKRVKNLQTLIDKNLGYVLFKQIEQVKIDLTKQDEATFAFNEHQIEINEPILLTTFEQEIIDTNIQKISTYLDTFLANNHISAKDIDVVFMTGGTSLVRPLRKVFLERFGENKIKSGDNFNSVAMGLAYSYKVFSETIIENH